MALVGLEDRLKNEKQPGVGEDDLAIFEELLCGG